MKIKTWHWMLALPGFALFFWLVRAGIDAGLDGRTVWHRHVTSHMHATPFGARLLLSLRGRDPMNDYLCPLEQAPIERTYITWPH